MRQRWEIEEEELEEGRRIRVRPGRTQSLVGGIVAIAMGIFAIVMFASFFRGMPFGGMMGGGAFTLFPLLFLVVVLAIAGLSFYNAFSKKGVPTYEIDIESKRERTAEGYCPNCGKPVGERDKFCRHCGYQLEDV